MLEVNKQMKTNVKEIFTENYFDILRERAVEVLGLHRKVFLFQTASCGVYLDEGNIVIQFNTIEYTGCKYLEKPSYTVDKGDYKITLKSTEEHADGYEYGHRTYDMISKSCKKQVIFPFKCYLVKSVQDYYKDYTVDEFYKSVIFSAESNLESITAEIEFYKVILKDLEKEIFNYELSDSELEEKVFGLCKMLYHSYKRNELILREAKKSQEGDRNIGYIKDIIGTILELEDASLNKLNLDK